MTIDTIDEKPSPYVSKKLIPPGSFSDRRLAKRMPLPRTKVLIIEENGEMRDHFKQFLGSDFELFVVSNPSEAIAVASLSPINIVVLDIEYEKEFEAVALTKQLRKLNSCKDAFFVSITGYVLPEGKSILKRTRFDYHMSKPFTLRRLRSLLHLCIAKETLSILNGIDLELSTSLSTTLAMAEV